MGYDYHIRRMSYEEEEALEPELSAAVEAACDEERWADYDRLKEQLQQALLERGARISLEEVRVAAECLEGMRWAEEQALSGRNPRTGEVITLPARPACGRFEVAINGEWTHGFDYRAGSLSWRAWHDVAAHDPMGRLMSQLALALNARIFGDEGEEYPLV